MTARASAILDAAGAALAGLADLLLPEVCSACSASEAGAARLCDDCNVRLLALVSLRYCPRCGTTLGPNVPIREDGCAFCPNPLPRFANVVRLGPYTHPLRRVVQGLKYHRRETMRRRLGLMLAQAVAGRDFEPPPEVIMPVAMHWRRRLARGYDHARNLARTVGRQLELPVGHELVRVRNTPPQVHLPRSQRIKNVRGAFSVHRGAGLRGAHVLLIDDVTTTGATANEAARALLSAGASRVTLAVVAKAEPPRAYADYLPGSD